MGNCSEKTEEDEKNRKNSQILKAYVFRHELWKVVFFAFNLFNPAKHALEVLQDTIYLNHLLIQQLEDFSKGRILKVRTQKKTMRKKRRDNQADDQDDEEVDASENESSDQEEHIVERDFNFIGELTILVDYGVISKYVYVMQHPILSKEVDLLAMTSSFFKRVLF